MSRFADVMRRTSERLLIPQPARSRVLFEIRADMEDLYYAYRAQGMTGDEAERRAVADCDLSREALTALSEVHSGPWRHFLDGLSAQTRGRVERGVLTALVVFVVVVCGGAVTTDGFIRDAGPASWPPLTALLAGVGLGLGKLYQLHLRQDHDPRRLRRGLGAVLALAIIQPLLALAGNGVALFAANLNLIIRVDESGRVLMDWLVASAATVIIGLVGALVCALLWQLAEAKVAAIESAEASVSLDLQGEERC